MVTITNDETHCILNNDLILLHIFSFLPIKYLNKLVRVCKQWKRFYFLFEFHFFKFNLFLKYIVRLIEEIIYCRKKEVFITLFRGKNWMYTNNPNKDVIISHEDFVNCFKKDLNKLMLEPEVFIYFLSRSYYENFRCIIKEFNREPIGDYELIRRRNIRTVSGLISSLLPQNSLQLMLVNEGIIGNDLKNYIEKNRNDIKMSKNEIIEDSMIGTINGFLLPNTSHSYRFSVKQLLNESEKLLDVHNEGDLYKFLGIQSDESLRFMFIFINDFYGII